MTSLIWGIFSIRQQPVHQQGGGDDGHSSVLCAADLNFAEQGMSAVNYILLQDDTFFGNE